MPRQGEPEKPVVFGRKGNFWLKYDTLADSKDKVMIDRLNQNLDILLIFAGLFSAINTAFIVLTLANLSAPPSYRTDALLTLIVTQVGNLTLTQDDLYPSFSPSNAAIRQNCTFFASLCTSILAAAGAVLAKQWLQSYERTGQTGSPQDQALLRTQKWMGAESWGLRPVVETLPTLLLISLALFFVALCDLLWSTSQPVAIVIVAFTATGAVFYGFTIIAAAINIFCPYQTAVSTVIRGVGLELRRLLLSISSPWTKAMQMWRVCHAGISTLFWRICGTSERAWRLPGGDTLENLMRHAGARLGRKSKRAETQPEGIYAHSIIWMLENATEEEDILACAENIPDLSSLSSTRIVSHSIHFSTLVHRFDAALTDVAYNTIERPEVSALVLGKAVLHVVIADPLRWAEPVVRALNAGGKGRIFLLQSRDGAGDLWALCCAAYLAWSALNPNSDKIKGRFLRRAVAVLPSSRPSTTLAFLSAMKLSRYGIPFHLVDSSTGHHDSLINLMCLEVIDLAEGSQQPLDRRVKEVWSARNGTNVVDYITKTVEAHDRVILGGMYRRYLLQYHIKVLKHYRSSRRASVWEASSDMATRTIIRHLSRIVTHCHPAADGQIMSGLTPTRISDGNDAIWEERFSSDPPVKADTVQAELRAYITQLLLCLDSPSLDVDRMRYSPEDTDTLVNGVAMARASLVTDSDIIQVLHTIELVISRQSDAHSINSANLSHRFDSVSPVLIRALVSTVDQVSDAAYGVLAAFGDMAWDRYR
ncbi:hypothetical protein FRB95_003182 [Tulasnella sp. JGI-2019a]|nr:hypothetical protein FRB93_005053 [Tulasnella sp. JGI-2019a]KAG9031071.1 hypothetical protein FRB95_003182 [Tulasnella sp. JGI-2019a]